MRQRIAADIGFGFVKALADSGGRVSFPSVIAPADDDGALNEALGAGRRKQRVTMTKSGSTRSTWLFGTAALNAPGATRPWSTQATDREGYDVLVYAAIASLLSSAGDQEIDLVLGLPLGVYGKQRDSLRAAFEGQEAFVAVGDGGVSHVWITSVLVLPQAAGAYYAEALASDGSVRAPELLRRPVGVIDVGFRTTDYFVMQRDDEGLRPVAALSGSLDAGIVEVYESVRRRAQSVTGFMLDALHVEAALRNQGGLLYVMGQEIALNTWVEEEAKNTAQRLMDSVRQVWGRHFASLGAVLLAGGGAIMLGNHLRGLHPGIKTVADPSFANARGFLFVAMRKRP